MSAVEVVNSRHDTQGQELMDEAGADCDRLLRSASIRLGAAQRDRLVWLVDWYGLPVLQSRNDARYAGGVVIVVDPPSGAQAERLHRSLHSGCAVVIPFGENPGFDFLKSKLTEFGTVGSCSEGPHEMWWGGIAWPMTPVIAGASTARAPRIISFHPRGGEIALRRLRHSLEQFELDSHIEPIATEPGDRMLCIEKVEFIVRMWKKYREPLLFVEAGAELHQPPLLPSSLGCDVALHKWNRWEMSARTLYLGRSEKAEKLLSIWHYLAASYRTIADGYLLDQAWSLASSQVSLDTVWLPRSYHAAKGDLSAGRAAIVHELHATTADLGPDPSFAALVRASRRAGRTGARDALIIINSEATSESAVAVIVRDIETKNASVVAATVEAVTDAFAADCGGYGRFELSLCAWQNDIGAAGQAARSAHYRVVEIAAGQPIPDNFFARLGPSAGAP